MTFFFKGVGRRQRNGKISGVLTAILLVEAVRAVPDAVADQQGVDAEAAGAAELLLVAAERAVGLVRAVQAVGDPVAAQRRGHALAAQAAEVAGAEAVGACRGGRRESERGRSAIRERTLRPWR